MKFYIDVTIGDTKKNVVTPVLMSIVVVEKSEKNLVQEKIGLTPALGFNRYLEYQDQDVLPYS